MKESTTIIVNKEVKLNNPILVAGLPGVGNVGKLVAEHLKKEFNGERIATLYSIHLLPKVVMLKSGGLRLASNRFYYIKSRKKNGNDIVVLTGDDQAITPEGQYEVNEKIVSFFREKLKGRFVYTVASYTTGEPVNGTPRVFGNATSKQVIEEFKGTDVLFGKSKGVILGSAGLIVAFAKRQKLDGICLMGETSFVDLDAAAAKSVLMVLAGRLGLEIDTQSLDKMIARTAKTIKDLEHQMTVAFPSMQGGSGPAQHEQNPSYIR
ncbi:MAG: proteasome assembly chaperone family protein [Candidatus Marsarchaeota archaeon]|jgi:uncharacterized protein (TIGR00162 family)|nr:proteasome assembly chaperone family protein [Candidatus Marsarchaeota archaeon]MCL5111717.1 proteasome assembly chaperone family protein [Candidatus Marsarchaeota archaeon]